MTWDPFAPLCECHSLRVCPAPDAPVCGNCGQIMAYHSVRLNECPYIKRIPASEASGG